MQDHEYKHPDGKRFFNPTLPNLETKSFWKGLRMWYSTPKAKWPKLVENKATPQILTSVPANHVGVTFVNHVTFVLQLPGVNIVTDPMWSKRASPFHFIGPARVRKPGIAMQDLPDIDLVLISHNHYDHLDIKSIKQLDKRFAPQFCIALGDSRIINKLRVHKYKELDWWQSIQINENTRITFTPTQHWSARGMFDQYHSLWGSYVIEHNGKKIFFGGDAGYSSHFSDIYKKFGVFDLAFVGIGAYEPRWFMKNMHTNPEEAVQIHKDLHAKLSIGMHYGTFQLSAEAIDQPLIDLNAAKIKHAIPENAFTTLDEGETRVIEL
ncbi:MAG TPA: MBL fold metallo-hydrolase [Gammaproteobacteria bacterium]|nr:MBL fold metallo-hydrolase [Gammaproteobacteria bacterium]